VPRVPRGGGASADRAGDERPARQSERPASQAHTGAAGGTRERPDHTAHRGPTGGPGTGPGIHQRPATSANRVPAWAPPLRVERLRRVERWAIVHDLPALRGPALPRLALEQAHEQIDQHGELARRELTAPVLEQAGEADLRSLQARYVRHFPANCAFCYCWRGRPTA
jgi:hypothetical protein